MTRLLCFVGLFAVVSSTLGCSSKQEAVPCEINSDCQLGEACINGECGNPECLSSADCALSEYCNVDYRCAAGCESDDDCVSGDTCNDGNCATAGCRDADLDCAYGEYCDSTTGQCYAADSVCEECDPTDGGDCFGDTERGPCSSAGGCPADQACYVAEYDASSTCRNDTECDADEICSEISFGGGVTEGPYCLRTACFSGSTYPTCDRTEAEPCPRGFHCQDFGSGEYCNADCGWLKENGHL